jgi:hypothetical protein
MTEPTEPARTFVFVSVEDAMSAARSLRCLVTAAAHDREKVVAEEGDEGDARRRMTILAPLSKVTRHAWSKVLGNADADTCEQAPSCDAAWLAMGDTLDRSIRVGALVLRVNGKSTFDVEDAEAAIVGALTRAATATERVTAAARGVAHIAATAGRDVGKWWNPSGVDDQPDNDPTSTPAPPHMDLAAASRFARVALTLMHPNTLRLPTSADQQLSPAWGDARSHVLRGEILCGSNPPYLVARATVSVLLATPTTEPRQARAHATVSLEAHLLTSVTQGNALDALAEEQYVTIEWDVVTV